MDEQPAHLEEARVLRQLLDGVAAVAQNTLLAVDESDGALSGAGIAVTVVERDGARLVAENGDVDGELFLCAGHDGQLVALAVEGQDRRLCGLCHWGSASPLI